MTVKLIVKEMKYDFELLLELLRENCLDVVAETDVITLMETEASKDSLVRIVKRAKRVGSDVFVVKHVDIINSLPKTANVTHFSHGIGERFLGKLARLSEWEAEFKRGRDFDRYFVTRRKLIVVSRRARAGGGEAWHMLSMSHQLSESLMWRLLFTFYGSFDSDGFPFSEAKFWQELQLLYPRKFTDENLANVINFFRGLQEWFA